MSNTVQHKRSSVASQVPTSSQLAVGEIAINLADQKLYSKKADGTVILVGNGVGGTGDVVGPSSATDNAIARFDGTTGKLIQNSTVTISDTGAIAGAESISNIDFAQFDTTVTPVEAIGKLQWDDGNGTLQVGLKGGNVNLQIGQELVARVYNDSGVVLTDGQVVYISGSQGNRIAVKLAKADSEATSAGTLGIVTEPIAIGAEGFITMTGTVNKLNTAGLTAGSLIYLSATTAGAYTTTAPTAPNHRVTLGYVERVDNVVGSIYVKVDNGYELEELHNVHITSPATNDFLVRNASNVWVNQTPATARTSLGLGTAATTDSSAYATAAQGAKADTALQPSDIGTTIQAYDSDLVAWAGITTSSKQDTLVSGTNIKTINNASVLGSGNISLVSGSITIAVVASLPGTPDSNTLYIVTG